MLDVKMTDHFAGHEIARQEIAGHEQWRTKNNDRAWNCGRTVL